MSDLEQHNSEEWPQNTPPDLKKAAESAKNDSLPSKSKQIYESTYDAFVNWKRQHDTKLTSESMAVTYFKELSKKYKPSTLWSIYSMLKATLKIEEKIDIDNYLTLKAFMKKQSSGFMSKKSNVLSSEEIGKFLTEAPDHEYLATKVALIFGITGACRSNELVNIKLKDITKQGDLLVVNLPTNTTKKPRSFVITEEFAKIVEKYLDLRPKNLTQNRFFLNYQKGKCTAQVIGIHKFSNMPKQIAIYLKLDKPETYTGRAFRRTSATLLADNGASIITLKRHDGCKSSTVAKGCITESIKNKSKIGNIMSASSMNFVSAEPSECNTDGPPLKIPKIEPFTSEEIISDIDQVVRDWQQNIDKSSSNVIETSPEKQNIVFNNCSFIIHQKSNQ